VINTEILYGELRRYENIKDEIIQTSIKAARLSKSVVYSAIRRDFETAAKSLAELEAVVERLKALIKEWPMFYGSAVTGLQEYVEAVALYRFLKDGSLPTRGELGVDVYTYLMGVSEIAGELGRAATESLLRGDVDTARRLKEAVEKLYLDLLALEPRDYDLRKKVDYVGSQANWITEKLFYATTCRVEE